MPHTRFDDLYMNTKRSVGAPWLKLQHARPKWLVELKHKTPTPPVVPQPVAPRDMNPWDPQPPQPQPPQQQPPQQQQPNQLPAQQYQPQPYGYQPTQREEERLGVGPEQPGAKPPQARQVGVVDQPQH